MADPGLAGRSRVFVVGTGRCGSTLFSNVVRMHPDLLSVSECLSSLITRNFISRALDGEGFWRLLTRPSPTVKIAATKKNLPKEFLYEFGPHARFTEANVPTLLHVTLPHLSPTPDALFEEVEAVVRPRPKAPIADQYDFLFSWLCERFGKKHWVERSGASLMYLPSLIKHFPDAKFVHVVRDGRDVALSIQGHVSLRMLAQTWADMRAVGLDVMKPPFVIGSNRFLASFEPAIGLLMQLDNSVGQPLSLKNAGSFWSNLVQVGTRNFESLPEAQRLVIYFEELVAHPRRELTRLIEFIDPGAMNEEWLDAAARLPQSRPSKWPDLPPKDRETLDAVCAPGLRLMGYPV